MPYTDEFRRQHDDLLAIVAEFRGLLQPEALRRDPRPARVLLSSLAARLAEHLSMEDSLVYLGLLRTGDERTRTLTRSVMAEMGGLGAVFQAYDAKWQVGAIAAEPTVFARASVRVMAALARSIERENRQLYPLADQSFVPAATEAP